jgi:hypothetical protein
MCPLSILVALPNVPVTLAAGHVILTTMVAPSGGGGALDLGRFGLDDHLVVLIAWTNANVQASSTDSAVPMALAVVHKE